MTELTRRAALAGVAATTLMPLTMAAPARAAAPLADKQAASFYRYNLGTYQITVVSDGVTVVPRPDNYVVNASKDEVSKVFVENYLPPDKATHSFNPIVINTGSKLIVVDTGLGPANFEQSKGKVGQFQTNLAAAGIDRNNVDTVIISHFHGDHINGLLTADNKSAYPNAEIMVPSAEWKFWMDDGEMSKASGDRMKGLFKNNRNIFEAGLKKKVTPYEWGKEVAPGLLAVDTVGHTPGHTSYVLSSGSGKVFIQSDVTNVPYLFAANPGWHAFFDQDGDVAEKSRRRVYDMLVADKLQVQGFHYPFPGLGNVEKDGSGYRVVPASWNPTI